MPESPALKKIGAFLRDRSGLEHFLDRLLRPVEILTKKPVFGCHMCGQCVLHSTGMVCPMNCPKNIRNGPCGGVRKNGNCEVFPEKKCVWLRPDGSMAGTKRASNTHDLKPPVNWLLEGSSSWVNYLTERDQISSGCKSIKISALQIIEENER